MLPSPVGKGNNIFQRDLNFVSVLRFAVFQKGRDVFDRAYRLKVTWYPYKHIPLKMSHLIPSRYLGA